MPVPIIRRFTATVSALSTAYNATDNESSLTFVRVTKPNAILDIVSSPAPTSGNYYTIKLKKNFVDTGRRFYSTALDPSSAGRIAVGPIGLGPGDYTFEVTQTAGTAANYSFEVKFADTL
jgi:hypothetical protein